MNVLNYPYIRSSAFRRYSLLVDNSRQPNSVSAWIKSYLVCDFNLKSWLFSSLGNVHSIYTGPGTPFLIRRAFINLFCINQNLFSSCEGQCDNKWWGFPTNTRLLQLERLQWQNTGRQGPGDQKHFPCFSTLPNCASLGRNHKYIV